MSGLKEKFRDLMPSSSITHYIKLDVSDYLDYPEYQFFMIKHGRSSIPVVGLNGENVVHWIEVILTDQETPKLEEISKLKEISEDFIVRRVVE